MSTSLDRAQAISWAIALRENPDFFRSRQHARLLLQGSRPTRDGVIRSALREIFAQDLLAQGLDFGQNITNFVDEMHAWLLSHPSNSIKGLEHLQRDYSAGTTQSFDSFYWRHRDRRMRCLPGEYFYHVKTWISTRARWSFLTETDPLDRGDALIVSVPFCDSGDAVPDIDSLVARCDELDIPVLIDCCYFVISSGIVLDLTSPAIDTVCFSLSKAFPVANLRIGLRYTRPGCFDGQHLMHSIRYAPSLSAWVGREILARFPCDYIHQIYRAKQQAVCDALGITASQSVLFATGDHRWDMYSRRHLLQTYQLDLDPATFHNRLCLVAIYDNWDIFEKVTHATQA